MANVNGLTAGLETTRLSVTEAERRLRTERDVRAVLYLQRLPRSEFEELVQALGLDDTAAKVADAQMEVA